MAYTLRFTGDGKAFTLFESDQVLTADQLNEIREYLDSQNHLTRLYLDGIGLASGLAVKDDLSAKNPSITVSRGSAVTSSGDLLVLPENRVFSYFKKYDDKNRDYKPFASVSALYELSESGQDTPLGKLEAPERYVCLLYLESYTFDPDICTGGSCDNKGKNWNENLRVLLVNADDAAALKGNVPDLRQCYQALGDLDQPRLLISTATIDTYDKLADAYRAVVSPTLKNVLEKLAASYGICKSILADAYPQDPTAVWQAKIKALLARLAQNPYGIQYAYDFLGDIIAAYCEFRESLLDDAFALWPARDAFPAHILLGALAPSKIGKNLRHDFYPSAACGRSAEAVDKACFLYGRLDALIRSFSLDAVINQSIRITPDKASGSELGERTIPYYYDLLKETPIQSWWSFEAAHWENEDRLLSYNAANYSSDDRTCHPLKYSLAGYPCLRIEGHLGKNYADAEQEINKLCADNDLAVRVLSLQIEDQFHILPGKLPGGLASLGMLHGLLRMDIHSRLIDLEKYTATLDTTIQQSKDLPEMEVGETKLSLKTFSLETAKALQEKTRALKTQIIMPLEEFNQEQFAKDFSDATTTVATYNKGIRGVMAQSSYSPFEDLINSTQVHWLPRISDILENIRDKMKRMTVLGRFLNKHPGLEHTGRVARGGTFVLVFSSITKNVLADFSLPYRCGELADEIDFDPIWPKVTLPPDWLGHNSLTVQPGRDGLLQKQIGNLRDDLVKAVTRIDDFDLKLITQQDSIKTYSGALNTVLDRINPAKATTTFTNSELANAASALDGIRSYSSMLDSKISAGKATEEEIAMRKSLDGVTAGIISRSVSEMSKGAQDIASGSEEERFLQLASDSAASIKDTQAAAGLSQTVARISKETTGKAVFSGKISSMIR